MARDSTKNLISYLGLMKLAIPSVLLESAPAGAQMIQTALLGHKATDYVAAWAVVSGTTNSVASIFNFLVMGVTAKVSKCSGAKAWGLVGSRIRLALGCSLVLGLISSCLLYSLKNPVFRLLHDVPSARGPAEDFYLLKSIGISLQLFAFSTTGILQGYKRVNLVAAINICRVGIDVFGSYIALFVLDSGMTGIGISNVAAALIAGVVAFLCVIFLPPPEAEGQIQIFPFFWTWWASIRRRLWLWKERRPTEHTEETPLLGENPDCGHHVEGGDGVTKAGSLALVTDEDEETVKLQSESLWKFILDGISFVIRNTFIQLSFFLVLVAASKLGVAALAAHQIVRNMWSVCIYLIDGFATAATIAGSNISGKLAVTQRGEEADSLLSDLKLMTRRVVEMGFGAGCLLTIIYLLFEHEIVALFTKDPLVQGELQNLWTFVSLVQPFNALVFVYDGLILAAQAFSFYAMVVVGGFFIVFMPSLIMAESVSKTLQAAWAAKVALNVVRLSGAAFHIHSRYLQLHNEQDEV